MFDFNSGNFDWGALVPPEKKETKAPAKKAEPVTKKDVKKETKKPEAKFTKEIILVTGFGQIQMVSDGEFDAKGIRSHLLEGDTFHEAASSSVQYIKAGERDGKDIVIACVERRFFNSTTANTKVLAGEYVMNVTEAEPLNDAKKKWQPWMQGDVNLYKVSDKEYGLFIDGDECKSIKDTTLIGYETEAENLSELLTELIGTDKLPENVKAKLISVSEDEDEPMAVLQFEYVTDRQLNAKGKSGSSKPTTTFKSEAEKDKEYMAGLVELPVTVRFTWGYSQEFTSDDFEGKSEVSLDEVFNKCGEIYSTLKSVSKTRDTFKYYGLVPVTGIEGQVRLIDFDDRQKKMASKGAACPF